MDSAILPLSTTLSALPLRAAKAAAGALVSGPCVLCTCHSLAQPGMPANWTNLGCALIGQSWVVKANSFRASVSRKKSQESPLPSHLKVGHKAPGSSVPTASLCFGVVCEWQRAQKKNDLNETDTDFSLF